MVWGNEVVLWFQEIRGDMTKKTNTFLIRGASVCAAGLFIAALINFLSMPATIPRCDSFQDCNMFREGTYYINLYSFYALIGLAICVLVFMCLMLVTEKSVRFIAPVQISNPDLRGTLAILAIVLLVGAVALFSSDKTSCAPGKHLTYGIDTHWCEKDSK